MKQLTGTERELMESVELWRPFLQRRLGDPWRTDEAVQLVREQVWFARDRFDPEVGSARTWVGGFARLIVIERLRALREAGERSGCLPPDAVGMDAGTVTDNVDDDRRLLQMVARHVDAADWAVVSTHAYTRSTAAAEAKLLGISVNSYRASLQRVQGVAETVRAVLVLADNDGELSDEALKACVSSRLGVADVLPWVDELDAGKTVAAQLGITLSAARNRLAVARRLLAIAESVAADAGR